MSNHLCSSNIFVLSILYWNQESISQESISQENHFIADINIFRLRPCSDKDRHRQDGNHRIRNFHHPFNNSYLKHHIGCRKMLYSTHHRVDRKKAPQTWQDQPIQSEMLSNRDTCLWMSTHLTSGSIRDLRISYRISIHRKLLLCIHHFFDYWFRRLWIQFDWYSEKKWIN